MLITAIGEVSTLIWYLQLVWKNQKMLKLLKGDADSYFIEAKEILVDLLNQQEYAEKKQYDVLRSAEFCRKTKTRLKEIIENQ